MAPAEPSGQDQAVARAAQAQRNKALAELSAQRAAEQQALLEGAADGSSGQGTIYDLLAGLIAYTWQPNKPSINLSEAELAQLPAII